MAITRQEFAKNQSAATATTITATFVTAIQAGEKVLVIVNATGASVPGAVTDTLGARYDPLFYAPGGGGRFEVFLCRGHPGGATVLTYTGDSSTRRSIGAWRITSTLPLAILHVAQPQQVVGTTATDGVSLAARQMYMASEGILFAVAWCPTASVSLVAGTNWSDAAGVDGGYDGAAVAYESRAISSSGDYTATWTAASANTFQALMLSLMESARQSPWVFSAGLNAGSAGSIDADMPPHSAGDYLILDIESCGGEAATLSSAQGFASIADSPVSTGTTTNGTRLTKFTKFATGTSDTAPTLADAGNHVQANVIAIRGVHASSPIDVTANSTKASASTAVTFPSDTTTKDMDLIVQVATEDLGTASPVMGHPSNANLQGLARCIDRRQSNGNAGGTMQAIGVMVTAGTIGTTSATMATSSVNASHTLALRSGLLVIVTGRADETETALAIAPTRLRSAGLASETDTALTPSGVRKIRATGIATETDTAVNPGHAKEKATGRADETDSAFALGTSLKIRATGMAEEIDTAVGFRATKAFRLLAGNETDTAIGPMLVQRSNETDSAFALRAVRIYACGMAVESDTALVSITSSTRTIRFPAFKHSRIDEFAITETGIAFSMTNSRIGFELEV